jgi:pre-mRNA-splicing factor CWC22
MASAETLPSRHLDDRSPPVRPRSPNGDRSPPRRDGGDSYRPGRDHGHNNNDRERPARRAPPPAPPAKTEEEKQAAAKAEYEKLLTMRSGGTYIPPARLRALQAQITDRSSKEYQRMAWEALKKSINGLINKVNVSNIKHIVPELFGENLVRGRGLFCQSITKAQAASLPFTPIYAAMAAIVNTKLPQVGELLVKRLVLRFRKAYKRNDKAVCLATSTFIAHLVNQQVVHETLAAQILVLLLQKPTDDSVEIAVGLTKEVGQHLEDMNPEIARIVFDQFRNILHEADIDKRVQYMIEVLFQIRKDKFKDNPAVKEELDLVEEEDQITHQVSLDGEIDGQDSLNVFRFDEKWEENEEAYKKLKAEILGEGSDDDDDEEEDEDESSSDEEDQEVKALEIKDQSNADLVNLRRTIYLTIMSSADPEESTHKLMKLRLPQGQEPELVSMIVECCAESKTYLKFFGLIGERFARLNRMWCDLFEESFMKYYDTIHRYETNKLRNIARFWGHLLATDAIGWHVLSIIHLNEEETTSASRIFIKILFQDLAENMGMKKLEARMAEETLQPSLQGIFPHDNPRNTRFSINYFTSIGMGALTQEMREYLQNMPKPALPAAPAADSDSESVSSYSSYTGSSYSSRSRSRTPPPRAIDRRRYESKSPPPRRGRSYTRSRSVSTRRSRSLSRSRSPRRDDYSRSPSPPPRKGRPQRYSRSPSYSSRSRSRSPPPRAAAAAPPRRRSPSDSRSPPPRRRLSSVDSRGRKRRDSYYSASPTQPPPPQRRRNGSSPSPRPNKRRAASYSASPSPPPQKKRYGSSYSRSRSPRPVRGGRATDSRSPSPPSRRDDGGPSSKRATAARYVDRSVSRSPLPVSRRDVRRGDGRSVSPPVMPAGKRRRRNSSSSRSRSPPLPAVKRGRVSG